MGLYDLDVNGFGFVRFEKEPPATVPATELSEPEKPWPDDITPSEPQTGAVGPPTAE